MERITQTQLSRLAPAALKWAVERAAPATLANHAVRSVAFPQSIATCTSRGQGATEYLVLISVVLGIALICITLLVGPTDTTKEVKQSQSATYWQSTRPFAILSHTQLAAPAGTKDYWAFDDGTGSSASDSVGGLIGTITNAQWVAGKYGSALNFTGSSSAVLTSSGISTTNSVTVEAWINPTFLWCYSGKSNTIVMLGTSSGTVGYHSLRLTCGEMRWEYANGMTASYKRVFYMPPLNTWTHIAVTHDYTAKEIKFYVNGVQMGATQTYVDNALPVSNKAVHIGSNGTASCNFNGTIDNVRIYDGPLSSGVISSLANEGMQMVVQNNANDYNTISTISVGGQNATVNVGFGAGEKTTLTLGITHGACTSGSKYEYNISIYYGTGDMSSLSQTGAQKLVGKCA